MIQVSQAFDEVSNLSCATQALTVSTTDQPVSYFMRGAGRHILCLHATGHASGDFEAMADRFADEYTVIAPDWPGQGRSPADGVKPTAHHYANIAIEFIEKLNLDRPVLLGNSIGGAAALIVAHRRPDLISGLALCNPGGLAKIDGTAKFFINRMVAFFQAGARGANWFDTAFSLYYRRLVLPRAPERAGEIISAGRALAPLLAQAWEGFADPKADLRDIATEIDVPVWFAWAKHDRLVAWGRSQKAARSVLRHTITHFNGGHSPFLEAPAQFDPNFKSFVEGLE